MSDLSAFFLTTAAISSTFIAISASFINERGEDYKKRLNLLLFDLNINSIKCAIKAPSIYQKATNSFDDERYKLQSLMASYFSLQKEYSTFLKRQNIFSKSNVHLFNFAFLSLIISFYLSINNNFNFENTIIDLWFFINNVFIFKFSSLFNLTLFLLPFAFGCYTYSYLKKTSYYNEITKTTDNTFPCENSLLSDLKINQDYPNLSLQIFVSLSIIKKDTTTEKNDFYKLFFLYNSPFNINNHPFQKDSSTYSKEYVCLLRSTKQCSRIEIPFNSKKIVYRSNETDPCTFIPLLPANSYYKHLLNYSESYIKDIDCTNIKKNL